MEQRLLLRLSVKLMALIGLLLVSWALLDSLDRPVEENIERLPLPQLAPGQLETLDWHGRRILLLGRSLVQNTRLDNLSDRVADPDGSHSEQPPDLPSPQRSRVERLFVAYNYGGEFHCPLEWVAAGEPSAPQPWLGGLRDRCQGTWYDSAGRVFKGQQVQRNLGVPPYRIDGPWLLLGAEH